MIQNHERNYYRKHCETLEKENEQLKAEITAVKLQLAAYANGEKPSAQAARKLLKEAVCATRMSHKLNRELTAKIKKVNEILRELKQVKPHYEQEMDRAFLELRKTVL